MIVGIPVVQLVLFGFAINSDPKHLPTALLDFDRSEFSRSIEPALANSDYFRFVGEARDEARSRPDARDGRGAVRRHGPGGLRARARARRAAGGAGRGRRHRPARHRQRARARCGQLAQSALARDLTGPLAPLAAKPGAFEFVVHPRYNPEAITQYNVVPGLIGVILTMTMVLITGLAITRERERGTMENLLSTPATALEVMTGKIVPYVADRPRSR